MDFMTKKSALETIISQIRQDVTGHPAAPCHHTSALMTTTTPTIVTTIFQIILSSQFPLVLFLHLLCNETFGISGTGFMGWMCFLSPTKGSDLAPSQKSTEPKI